MLTTSPWLGPERETNWISVTQAQETKMSNGKLPKTGIIVLSLSWIRRKFCLCFISASQQGAAVI